MRSAFDRFCQRILTGQGVQSAMVLTRLESQGVIK